MNVSLGILPRILFISHVIISCLIRAQSSFPSTRSEIAWRRRRCLRSVADTSVCSSNLLTLFGVIDNITVVLVLCYFNTVFSRWVENLEGKQEYKKRRGLCNTVTPLKNRKKKTSVGVLPKGFKPTTFQCSTTEPQETCRDLDHHCYCLDQKGDWWSIGEDYKTAYRSQEPTCFLR